MTEEEREKRRKNLEKFKRSKIGESTGPESRPKGEAGEESYWDPNTNSWKKRPTVKLPPPPKAEEKKEEKKSSSLGSIMNGYKKKGRLA
jgi:hypothetical protein